MNNRKSLKDLNLLDRFLFAEAMEDPEIARTMLEIILGKDLVLKYLPQTEKEIRANPAKRFVKLDVWMMDSDNVVYDAEAAPVNRGQHGQKHLNWRACCVTFTPRTSSTRRSSALQARQFKLL